MKGYKAFKKGMICRDKQYQENTTYEEKGADKCCEAGVMHFCENPLDVMNYYPIVDEDGNLVEVAEVEALDDVLKVRDKCATKKLHIGAKLSFKDYIKAAVEFTIEKTHGAKIGSSGDDAKIGSSGDGAQIGSSGDDAQIGSSGDYAKIGSSGYGAQIGSSGYGAQIGSSGDGAKIGSSGDGSVVAAIGMNSQAKASVGSWITLAEYGEWNGKYYQPICVKTEYVDGEKIKADTFYQLINGEFKEVSQEAV